VLRPQSSGRAVCQEGQQQQLAHVQDNEQLQSMPVLSPMSLSLIVEGIASPQQQQQQQQPLPRPWTVMGPMDSSTLLAAASGIPTCRPPPPANPLLLPHHSTEANRTSPSTWPQKQLVQLQL